ncbi:MAG: sugar phosphate nucleotidyltransferase [candidate division WOR-3 bacterium]
MHIIIPVAGKGTRLYPLTHTTPKPLIPVAGKPILGHMLERLVPLDPERITLVVNPGTQDPIKGYAESVAPSLVDCAVQETPLGIAHAVMTGGIGPGPSLIILGDTIIDAPLAFWIREGDFMGVKPVDDPRRFGVVELDPDGRIVSAVEKPDEPKSNLALVGLYYLSDGAALKDAIERLIASETKTKNEYQITDAINLMLSAGWRPLAREIEEWFDCGKISTLLESNALLLEKYPPKAPDLPGVEIVPPVSLHPTATIKGGRIGPHVTVMENANLEDCIISSSILSSSARLFNCQLRDSVIGRNAVVKGFSGSLCLGDDSVVEVP